MNKTKMQAVILIVSMFFFVGTIGIIVFMSQIDKQTEYTTTYYSATVSAVQVTNTEKSIYAEIRTKEYDNALQISTNITKNINMDDVSNLKSGQKIFFRIENIKVDQINKVDFINIVSLKTEAKEIFSLEDYNTYISNSAYPARIASITFALLFLSISIFCFFSVKQRLKL